MAQLGRADDHVGSPHPSWIGHVDHGVEANYVDGACAFSLCSTTHEQPLASACLKRASSIGQHRFSRIPSGHQQRRDPGDRTPRLSCMERYTGCPHDRGLTEA